MAKLETMTKELSKEKVNIGLTEHQREGVVETLNRVLADETVLYIKTRNYHWNVVGPRFHQLHELFEEQYTKVAGIIDDVAENARQFGGHATGTMAEYLEKTRLKEQPGTYPDEDGMIGDLLANHESIIRNLRSDIDKATDELHALEAADFLTQVLEAHNKMAWMLRAFHPK